MRALSRCLLGSMLLATAACATVAPYEREHLSRRGVDTSGEAGEDAFRSHVYSSREGALGGTGASGAGCGCN